MSVLYNYLKVVRDVKTRQKWVKNAENGGKKLSQTPQLHTTAVLCGNYTNPYKGYFGYFHRKGFIEYLLGYE